MTYISRKIRRKYQTGGLIPSSEALGTFTGRATPLPQIRPPQPSVDITPLVQANNVVQQNLRTAIARAAESRAERQDMWDKEVNHRNFMQDRITELRGEITAGINKANLLDYNIAEQRMLGEQMNKEMERYKQMGLDALTNERLKPQDRYERLQEAVMGTQQLFTNPEYSNYVKANNLTQKYLDKAMEDLADNDKLIDNNKFVANFQRLNEVRSNPALLNKFFEKHEAYEIDVEGGKGFEQSVFQMIQDALSKDAAVLEKYSGDQNSVIFLEKVKFGSEEEQAQAVFEQLWNSELWKRWAEHPRSGKGLTYDGAINEDKVMDYARRLVRLARSSKSLSPEQGEITVGGQRYGSAYNTVQERAMGKETLVSSLADNYSLVARDPSALDIAVAKGHSASDIDFIRKTPIEDLLGKDLYDTDFYLYKSTYDRAFEPTGGPTPQSVDGAGGIPVDVNEGGDTPEGTPEGTPQEQRGRSYLPFGGQGGIFGNIPVGPLPFGVNPRKQPEAQAATTTTTQPTTTQERQEPGPIPDNISYLSLEKHESSNGQFMINRDDQGKASVGPMQYNGSLGEKFLRDELGITGYNLKKVMTDEEAAKLKAEFDRIGRDNVMQASRRFFEREVLPELSDRLEGIPLPTGVSASNLPQSLELPLHSMLVNHSSKGKDKIMKSVAEKLKNNPNPTKADVINAVQDARVEYIMPLNLKHKSTLLTRYKEERDEALIHASIEPDTQSQQIPVTQTTLSGWESLREEAGEN